MLRDGYFNVSTAADYLWDNDVRGTSVFITPPTNANADITDEDSAAEDQDDIRRMSSRQLLADAEIKLPNGQIVNVSSSW
jgi:hypothetical protein